jgi:predicted RNase H-like HicB family nuclease
MTGDDEMSLYDIQIKVERLRDGGDYQYVATSPDLPGLLVAGDTAEEVLNLAPDVASALIALLKASGDLLPDSLHPISESSFTSHITVPA